MTAEVSALGLTAVIDRRYRWEFVPSIKIHDLPEQCDFFHTARDQFAHLVYDFVDSAAAFGPARPRHDTKRAMHVAALHDRDERGRLLRSERLLANGRL